MRLSILTPPPLTHCQWVGRGRRQCAKLTIGLLTKKPYFWQWICMLMIHLITQVVIVVTYEWYPRDQCQPIRNWFKREGYHILGNGKTDNNWRHGWEGRRAQCRQKIILSWSTCSKWKRYCLFSRLLCRLLRAALLELNWHCPSSHLGSHCIECTVLFPEKARTRNIFLFIAKIPRRAKFRIFLATDFSPSDCEVKGSFFSSH